MTELLLSGLDGKNPLAFLAALGVLNVLADAAKPEKPEPKLIWRSRGTYLPVLVGDLDRAALLDVLGQDLRSFRGEPAIETLRYRKKGDEDGSEAHDLKPPKGTLSYAFDVNLSGQATGVMTDQSGFRARRPRFFLRPRLRTRPTSATSAAPIPSRSPSKTGAW